MERLREHVVNSLKGGQAFVPIEKAINNLSPAVRNKKPSENLHSIWEELEHLRIAQKDLLQYIINPEWQSPKWPEGYWAKPTTDLSDDQRDKTYNGFINDLNKIIEQILRIMRPGRCLGMMLKGKNRPLFMAYSLKRLIIKINIY